MSDLSCEEKNGHESYAPSQEPGEQPSSEAEIESNILLFKSILQWSAGLNDLALLELRRSFSALKLLVFIKFFLFPASILLYISFCLFACAIAYEWLNSIYLSIGVAIALQLLAILSIHFYSRSLEKRIGFDRTTKELGEMASLIQRKHRGKHEQA